MPEGLTLNGLSLNNGSTHILTELQLPIPAKKPEWIEGADADGAVLMRDPLVENGTLVAKLDLYTANKDAANAAIGAIVDELEEADRNPAGIPVVWTPVNGTKSLTFYALSGEVTELPMDTKSVDANVPTVQITLKCRPGGYGALVTGPTVTTAGPVVQLDIPSVPGDMPTDEAYIVITDTSSQSRRHVEWGAQYLHYNTGALIIDSDSMTVTGYSGTQSSTSIGAYDPNAAGTSSIVVTGMDGAWTTVASTGAQTHKGTFRVKARVYVGPGDAYWRLAWRVGDGPLTLNDGTFATVLGANGAWREVDLGLVSIAPATAGTHAWEGFVQMNGWGSWFLDYLILVPVDAGYGRARGEQTPGAGTVVAYDTFSQAVGALNTRTLTFGGSWATSGTSATDFQNTGSTVTRTAASEAAWAGRFAVAGSTNYTNTQVSLLFTAHAYHSSGTGPVARYVDSSNWVTAVYYSEPKAGGGSEGSVRVYKNVAGAKTLIGTSSTISTPSFTVVRTLTLDVTETGTFTATLTVGGVVSQTATGVDSALATGATLATGKPGFYSEQRGTSHTQSMDTFTVFTVPALAPAMYSGRTLEITSAEARRQNSAGTMYGTPGVYRGSRFMLNPQGAAGRTTRVIAKAHRNDVDDMGAAATPITDSLKLQVFYRPRYSVVPR